MRTSDRTWLAVGIAGCLGSATLLPLTTDSSYLYPAWLVIGALCAAAIVGDRLHLSKALVNLVQVLLATALAISLAIGPGPSDVVWYGRLVPLLRSGYDHIRTQSAPMEPNAGARIILVLVVVTLTLVAGVIADTLERPAWTLAPLLTLYLVPAIALRTDVNVFSFLVVVVGYLGVLFADGLNNDRSWTRNLSHDSAGVSRGSRGIWRLAAVVTVPTVIGAIVLGMFLPTMSTTFVNSLRPNGSGPIQMIDPQIDLRKNLEQGASREVLSYTTNKDTGTYLRLATLPLLTADGWAQSQVTLKQGAIGPVPGVSSAPSSGSRITNIQIDDLASMYLPVPYAPRAQNATGEWSYDPASLMIIATGSNRNQATQGQRYTVESWDVEPDGATFADAQVGVPDGQSMTLDVSSDVPADIIQLTNQIVDGIDSPALKAAAIQSYLRSSQFSYSVQGASGRTSYDALETFLLKTKSGYCVQFAGAMALMARIAGIPSRVAVGFLPGTKSGDRYIVTSHDMHAWPELYFEGEGWVRFEPTPSVAVPPPWSVVAENQPSPSVSTVAEPSLSASAAPTAQASQDQNVPDQNHNGGTATTPSWERSLAIGIALVVLLILVAAPMVLRRLIRRSRLRPTTDPYESVARAWREIRDSWLDLGHRWPRGTPRQIGEVLAERLTSEPAATSLSGVVDAVERSRYAATFETDDALASEVDDVLAGLRATRPWWRGANQTLLPVSLVVSMRAWWSRVTSGSRRPEPVDEEPRHSEADDEAFRRPVGAGRS